MNTSDKNTKEPEQSEHELKIEDLSVEDSPDAQDEDIKGGLGAKRIDAVIYN